jgi:hypothetical protein
MIRKTLLSASICTILGLGASAAPAAISKTIPQKFELSAGPSLTRPQVNPTLLQRPIKPIGPIGGDDPSIGENLKIPGNDPLVDPAGVVHSAVLKDAAIGKYSSSRLTRENFSTVPRDYKKPDPDKTRPPEKIHPGLAKLLAGADPNQVETVVINFRDDLTIPRFPLPAAEGGSREKQLKQAEELVRQIKQQRAQGYEKLAEQLNGRYGIEMKDTFWLINAVVAKAPLSSIKELAARDDVMYVELENDGSKPPADSVAEGRSQMHTDPYFNLGQTSGYIGLLDTGLRFTHTLFDSPSNIDFRYDCTDGTCNNTPDPTDDCWNHGTSTAAIISGNNNLGNDYRGVTGVTLDSFKVYPAGCGGLNTTASVKAFEKAVAVLDRVIVAEMQGGGSATSSISTAADAAFDAGAVIIAANGNFGPNASTVNAPANAHKVLGIGGYLIDTLAQYNNQSRGPAGDGRVKPDVQAPTWSRTASNASDTANRIFTGTSGATPYGAGAAALTRNWMRGINFSIDPGHVYARMILAGQDPYPFDNTVGAGKIVLGTGGHAWWGKVVVGNHVTVEIPINVSSGKGKIEGSLWWPEDAADSHADIDLKLVDPNGVVRDSSISVNSVFERTRFTASNLQSGTWKVRIYGWSVPGSSQTVYWSARTR